MIYDMIAKAADRDNENTTTYNRIPKSTLYQELEEKTIIKWQKAWEVSPKAALTKQFFPNISDRLKTKIKVTPNFTAPVTDTEKPEPTCTGLNYWKVQHVSAARKSKPRTI
jgi:hypothetical protein